MPQVRILVIPTMYMGQSMPGRGCHVDASYYTVHMMIGLDWIGLIYPLWEISIHFTHQCHGIRNSRTPLASHLQGPSPLAKQV